MNSEMLDQSMELETVIKHVFGLVLVYGTHPNNYLMTINSMNTFIRLTCIPSLAKDDKERINMKRLNEEHWLFVTSCSWPITKFPSTSVPLLHPKRMSSNRMYIGCYYFTWISTKNMFQRSQLLGKMQLWGVNMFTWKGKRYTCM